MREFQKFLMLREPTTDVLCRIADCFMALSKWPDALPYVEETMKMSPDSPDLFLRRARLFDSMGESSKAEADFAHLRLISPQMADDSVEAAREAAADPQATLDDLRFARDSLRLACASVQRTAESFWRRLRF